MLDRTLIFCFGKELDEIIPCSIGKRKKQRTYLDWSAESYVDANSKELFVCELHTDWQLNYCLELLLQVGILPEVRFS